MASTQQRQAAARQAKREANQAVKHVNACTMLTQDAKALCEARRFDEVIAHQVVEIALRRAGPLDYKYQGMLMNAPLVGMTRDELVRFAKSNSRLTDEDFDDKYFAGSKEKPYVIAMFIHLDGEDQKLAHYCRVNQRPTKEVVEHMVLTMPAIAMGAAFNDANHERFMKDMLGSL